MKMEFEFVDKENIDINSGGKVIGRIVSAPEETSAGEENKKPKEKIFEIRISRTENLGKSGKDEVEKKLKTIVRDFDYRGWCKINYMSSPTGIYISSVDPIEGTCLDFYKKVFKDASVFGDDEK